MGMSVVMAVACGAKRSTTASPVGEPSPEEAWLDGVGTGQAQTARVCARGARDRVAQALCASSPAAISGLEELYDALQLGSRDKRRLATSTHSLSLSGRTVSGANPRVLVLADNSVPGGLSYEGVVATAFSRGEQRVELVAIDPTTYEYNFYLLRFEQECNASRCTPEDLLTRRIESGWTDWTLYADSDLEDTPLDCLSCHRPFGGDTHKSLLMRQVLDPWMHWSDFRTFDENMCPDPPPNGVPAKVIVTSEGLDLLASLEGEQGKYGGIPLADLRAAPSGDALTAFLVDAELLIATSPLPPHPYGQMSLQTRETLCERYYTGQSPSWEAGRLASRSRGLPFPYYAPDVISTTARAELLASGADFWKERDGADPFDTLAALHDPEVPAAVGFVPRESDTANEILQGMCGRCHAPDVSLRLQRSRFNVADANIQPATFQEISRRLALPPGSPHAMPPRVAGALPPWAVDRLLGYLASFCSTPNGCQQTR